MDFLELTGKTVLVCGVANRKSVAFHIARLLHQVGAEVILSVRTAERQESVSQLVSSWERPVPVLVCDVEQDDQIAQLADEVAEHLAKSGQRLWGLVHSIAFADYSAIAGPEGLKAYHQTPRASFLQAVDISCFSLTALANSLRDHFDPDGSVVTISISTTRMASENYGFMAPAKAALDSSVAFLAKSFSQFSRVRFNAVCAGLLRTSASAGIPGYVESYLYAEQMTLRKQAVTTEEVANAAIFLLSPRSSGLNTQRLIVDAGMEVNFFDQEMIQRAMRP